MRNKRKKKRIARNDGKMLLAGRKVSSQIIGINGPIFGFIMALNVGQTNKSVMYLVETIVRFIGVVGNGCFQRFVKMMTSQLYYM